MCKVSDIRLYEVVEQGDDWFETTTYTCTFWGSRGFHDETWTSEATSWGPDLYHGKTGYKCVSCLSLFDSYHRAQLHAEPDDDDVEPQPLKWFGLQ